MSELPVIFQGTFDPFTNGHLDILQKALALFGQVRVLLLVNPDKKPLFSLDERKEIILHATQHLSGVSVDSSQGLLVDYMRARGLTVCVRGVRNQTDAAYELYNAHLSKQLYPPLTTCFIACAAELKTLSSSSIKEAWARGENPENQVCAYAQNLFSRRAAKNSSRSFGLFV